MSEKESMLKGKGLEIASHTDGKPTLLGSLATRSTMTHEAEPRIRGKGLGIARGAEAYAEEPETLYRSAKNGDLYVIADGPVGKGLVRLRNVRNGSIATLSADALSDSGRFTLDDHV